MRKRSLSATFFPDCTTKFRLRTHLSEGAGTFPPFSPVYGGDGARMSQSGLCFPDARDGLRGAALIILRHPRRNQAAAVK